MAINFYDIAYGFGVGISAPVWIVRSKTRKKVLDAFSKRMGHVAPRNNDRPAIMIHAVSVGELNAARGLIDELRKSHPEMQFIVSTTTQTGYERAQQLYADTPDVILIQYPLDFSAAVSRVLDHLKPCLVILMELELWPNFIARCRSRGIPVMLANGRITLPSFKGYRIGSWLTRRMFAYLSSVCAQEETYADRFKQLGADPAKITVTGTMKFDTAPDASKISGIEELASQMQITHPLWVCGSTGPGEEEIVLDVYNQLLAEYLDLRLAIIPRKPERFDEVAKQIEAAGFSCLRRSTNQLQTPNSKLPTVLLGDTMGELRKFYALADVVFVGRSLVDLGDKQHGSDMIEPAALAKPTIVGPFTGNFAEVMNAFRDQKAMIEVATADELKSAVSLLLHSPASIGHEAQRVVVTQRGATQRTLEQIEKILATAATSQAK